LLAREGILHSGAALLRLPAVGDNADVETELPDAEPPKRKRRWYQFSLRTLLVVTILACLVAMEVFKGRIGTWLFGRLVIYKTQFTPMDCERLKGLLGMELPVDATIDWAMFFHTFRGETDTAFRIKMSSREAKALRQRVAATGTIDENFNARLLTPDDESLGLKSQMEAAFSMNGPSVDFVVFCKPENDEVPVYFCIYGWPVRDIHAIDGIFIPSR
jgi:hypothetical protein